MTKTKTKASKTDASKATSDIVAAVKTLLEASADYVASARLPDPKDPKRPYPLTPPSAPPSAEHVAEAERLLGVTFPPSYRQFLSLHDGWKDFDMGSNLLDVKALVTFSTSQAPKVLPKILDELERKTAKGLLVIATSGRTPALIFDTSKTNKAGEWPVLEYDKEEGLLDEYDSFLAALEGTADTMRTMAGPKKR